MNELHRKQRKELQAQVQSLKKSVTKGDKKRKKEVDAEIERLESEFEQKCQLELKMLNAVAKDTATKEESGADDGEMAFKKSLDGPQKPSKAQKRREKKEKSEADRDLEIARHREFIFK